MRSLSHPRWERQAKRLAGLFPNIRVEVYEGRSHIDAPQRAEPVRFARALRELWAGSAVYIDPRNARALAVALRRVCEDDALRAKLQSAAARRAGRYQLSAMVDAYGKVYRELLSQPLNEKVHAHSPSAGGVA